MKPDWVRVFRGGGGGRTAAGGEAPVYSTSGPAVLHHPGSNRGEGVCVCVCVCVCWRGCPQHMVTQLNQQCWFDCSGKLGRFSIPQLFSSPEVRPLSSQLMGKKTQTRKTLLSCYREDQL